MCNRGGTAFAIKRRTVLDASMFQVLCKEAVCTTLIQEKGITRDTNPRRTTHKASTRAMSHWYNDKLLILELNSNCGVYSD